jgi:hypothetical protein
MVLTYLCAFSCIFFKETNKKEGSKMLRRIAISTLAVAVVIFSCFSLRGQEASGKASCEYKLVGPFSYKNIDIWLLAGKQGINKNYYPLNMAMGKGFAEVFETGNVNNLSIENKSDEHSVFVNAGDVVKGGKQDRALSFDLIIGPNSGKVSIQSFCVESNRWKRRGSEKLDKFSGNNSILPSKNLRIASKYRRKQGEVWENVAEEQKKLNRNVKKMSSKKEVDVISNKSCSSLQLTMESKDLKKITGEYMTGFDKIFEGHEDILGFAYAINGKVNNAEVYNNYNLFRDLWPKLLKAAVIEAIAEFDESVKFEKARAHDFEDMFIKSTQGAKAKERILNKDTKMLDYETDGFLLFETLDMGEDGKWIHRNYIRKGKGFRKNIPSGNASSQRINFRQTRNNCPF